MYCQTSNIDFRLDPLFFNHVSFMKIAWIVFLAMWYQVSTSPKIMLVLRKPWSKVDGRLWHWVSLSTLICMFSANIGSNWEAPTELGIATNHFGLHSHFWINDHTDSKQWWYVAYCCTNLVVCMARLITNGSIKK